MTLTWTLLVAALLSGCGATASAPATSDGIRPAILDFTAATAEGTALEGATLAGKPVVFWFWAPWCPTCRAQAPAVQALAERHDGEVHVVGVGGLDQEAAIQEYAQQVPAVTHVVDPEGALWRHLGVTAQSTYLVLDEHGTEIAQGYLDNGALAEVVEDLVS